MVRYYPTLMRQMAFGVQKVSPEYGLEFTRKTLLKVGYRASPLFSRIPERSANAGGVDLMPGDFPASYEEDGDVKAVVLPQDEV
jgi:hypothetical protein